MYLLQKINNYGFSYIKSGLKGTSELCIKVTLDFFSLTITKKS